MTLNEQAQKEIQRLIGGYEKKLREARGNYEDTGYDRYWNTIKRCEDMIDFLKNGAGLAESANKATSLQTAINNMAYTIRDFSYMSTERREQETKEILDQIMNLAVLRPR